MNPYIPLSALGLLSCFSIGMWVRVLLRPNGWTFRRSFLIPLGIFDLLVVLFIISGIQTLVQGLDAAPGSSETSGTNVSPVADKNFWAPAATDHRPTLAWISPSPIWQASDTPAASSSGTLDSAVQRVDDTEASPRSPAPTIRLIGPLSQLLAVGLALAWLTWRYRVAIQEWCWVSPSQWRSLLIQSGQAWLMILPPILILHSGISQWVAYRHPTIAEMQALPDSFSLFVSWLGAVIAAPLFEEFFYRGLMIHWMTHAMLASWGNFDRVILGNWFVESGVDQRYSPLAPQWELTPETLGALWGNHRLATWGWLLVYWGPIVVSAALFGLAHWGQGLAAIPLFFLGLFLGVLFRQTRSLWPCLLVHLAFNAYTMFWVTLSVVLAGDH
jgi:membrane protease YdiL (CAAX protease family)